VRKPKPAKSRDRRLSKDEEKKLLKTADEKSNKEFGVIVRLGLYTAMRQGEIIDLRWENVDLNKCIAILYDTKNGEIRGVPLSSKAVSAISKLDIKEEGQVFTYTKSGFRVLWRRMIIGLGVLDFRFHDLRHEATSRFFEKGLNPIEVASITGHKTLHMLKRYTHLRAEDLAKKLD
jgi:integrase